MPNEFVIKNGFQSKGNSIVEGSLTVTSLSATTYQNLPQDIFVSGGTYDNNTGTATFTNTSGGTFNVSGFMTGSTSSSFDYGKTYVIANNQQWF